MKGEGGGEEGGGYDIVAEWFLRRGEDRPRCSAALLSSQAATDTC